MYFVQTNSILCGVGTLAGDVIGEAPPQLVAPVVSATQGACDGVTLSWTLSAGASNYSIHRAPSTDFTQSTPIGQVATPTFVDASAEPDVHYHYWVAAHPSCEQTALSASAEGWTDSCDSTLSVPSEYPTIGAALAAAQDGDTIEVAGGIFHEHLFISDVQVSIVAAAADAQVILDGDGLPGSLLVMTGSQGPSSVVRGITFRNAHGGSPLPSAPHVFVGGAVLLNAVSPTFEACRFEQCSAPYGGAVYAFGGAPTFIECEFSGNSATFDGGALQALNAGATLDGCLFADNLAGDRGGAMHFVGLPGPTVHIEGCEVVDNTATTGGGLSYWAEPGAHVVVSDSSFTSNAADSGGAIWVRPEVDNALEMGATTICSNSSPQFVAGAYTDLGGNALCSCPPDLNGDGNVGAPDLAILLGGWGSPAGDVTGDGTTNQNDIAILLGAWGPC